MRADGGENLRVVVGVTEDRPKDALGNGERGVVDQGLGVHDLAEPQAVAVGAGAIGRVEREVARLQVVDRVPVDGAGQGQRVLQELARHGLGVITVGQEVDAHLAGGQLGRLLDGLNNTVEGVLANHDAIHYDLDRVLELLLETDLAVELADLAVDAHAAKALAAQVLEELGVLALAAEDHRRKHQRTTTLPLRQDLVGNLVGCLALDHASALRAVGHTHARKE